MNAPEGWVLPDGYTFMALSRCKGCGVRMLWADSPAGKATPLDADGTNHFITCPKRDQFRKKGANDASAK